MVSQRRCHAEAAPRLTLGSQHGLFEDQRGFHLAITVAKVEAMGVFALDLGANPNDWDGFAACPVFHLNAKTPPDTQAAHILANDKAADNGACSVLQMPFHRGVDPAHNLIVDNGGEGDPVGSARQLLDALAKILRRAGIAELAAQRSGCFCVIDREPADGDGYAVRLGGGTHIGIIARLLGHFQLEQDHRTLGD